MSAETGHCRGDTLRARLHLAWGSGEPRIGRLSHEHKTEQPDGLIGTYLFQQRIARRPHADQELGHCLSSPVTPKSHWHCCYQPGRSPQPSKEGLRTVHVR